MKMVCQGLWRCQQYSYQANERQQFSNHCPASRESYEFVHWVLCGLQSVGFGSNKRKSNLSEPCTRDDSCQTKERESINQWEEKFNVTKHCRGNVDLKSCNLHYTCLPMLQFCRNSSKTCACIYPLYSLPGAPIVFLLRLRLWHWFLWYCCKNS